MMKNDSKKTLWAGMSKRLNLQTIHYFLCFKKNGKVRLKTPSFGCKFPMVAHVQIQNQSVLLSSEELHW